MKAGGLDSRVVLEEPSVVRTALGDEVKSWRRIGEFWADVRHLSGREYSRGNIDTEQAKTSVRIRLNREVTPASRLICRGTVYRIEAVLHDELRREYTDLVCIRMTGGEG